MWHGLCDDRLVGLACRYLTRATLWMVKLRLFPTIATNAPARGIINVLRHTKRVRMDSCMQLPLVPYLK